MGWSTYSLTSSSKVINSDWLEKLLGYVQRETTGAVGGKVFSKEDTLLQAGVVVAGDDGKIFLNQGLGDDVYGKSSKLCEGQCLHAKKIGFVHPVNGQYYEFDSELPDYFDNALIKIKKM